MKQLLVAIGVFVAVAVLAHADDAEVTAVRVGHFPNMTHAQALVGQHNGWFDSRVSTPIEWKSFNAGPSAIEALLAGALDLTYVGPSPAINVYVRSHGEAIRIVAGAANGGASLIVRKDSGITTPEDFRGKKVASPEVGNTQDVALRYWLKSYGLAPRAQNGDVDVLAVRNADILALFQRGSLDAAWVPEPWATRLMHEAAGERFLDERTLWPEGQFPTVLLVVRTKFLAQHRDLVEQFVHAHIGLTQWIAAHPDDARHMINRSLEHALGQGLPDAILQEAFGRFEVTVNPAPEALSVLAARAWTLGYLPGAEPPHVTGAVDVFAFQRTSLQERR